MKSVMGVEVLEFRRGRTSDVIPQPQDFISVGTDGGVDKGWVQALAS